MIWIALGCLPFLAGFIHLMLREDRREWLVAAGITLGIIAVLGGAIASIVGGLVEIGVLRK